MRGCVEGAWVCGRRVGVCNTCGEVECICGCGRRAGVCKARMCVEGVRGWASVDSAHGPGEAVVGRKACAKGVSM
eukprot:8717-Chlamydomonas_euryale.AAC.1